MGEIVRIPIKTEVKARKRNIYVQDAGDVKRLMNSIINDLRNGEIDSKSANAIGYLANIILKTIEVGETVSKMQGLEDKMNELNSQNSYKSSVL